MVNAMPAPTSISDDATIGELYRPCAKITDSEEARKYVETLTAWCMRRSGRSYEDARAVQLSNIGYYSGYFDKETSLRMRTLFNAEHPVFGHTYPEVGFAYGEGKGEG